MVCMIVYDASIQQVGLMTNDRDILVLTKPSWLAITQWLI